MQLPSLWHLRGKNFDEGESAWIVYGLKQALFCAVMALKSDAPQRGASRRLHHLIGCLHSTLASSAAAFILQEGLNRV
jgi:hypothetical protein